jgi:uncharacterized protein involved in outer membrane biogenesis
MARYLWGISLLTVSNFRRRILAYLLVALIPLAVHAQATKLPAESGPHKPAAPTKTTDGVRIQLSFTLDSLAGGQQLAPSARGPMNIEGTFRQQGAILKLDDAHVRLGPDMSLRGNLEWQTGGSRPNLAAVLQADNLNLTPFLAIPAGEVKSTAPPDLSALRTFDAAITLRANRLTVPDFTLHDMDFGIKLKDGQLVVEPMTAKIAGGKLKTPTPVNGRLELQAVGQRPSLLANLQADTLDITPFFPEDGGKQAKAGGAAALPIPEWLDAIVNLRVQKLIAPKLELGELQLGLNLANGRLRLDPVTAQVAGGALQASASLSGQQAGEVDALVSYEAATTRGIAKLLETNAPEVGPVMLKAALRGQDGIYNLSEFTARAGQSHLTGLGQLNLRGERPMLNGSLLSDKLDLTQWLPEDKQKKKGGRLFSNDPLPLEALRSVDANLKLDAKQVVTHDLVLQDLKAEIGLQSGLLKIAPLTARAAGGQIQALLELDARGKQGLLRSDLKANGVELGQFRQFQEKQVIQGGKTDAQFSAAGKGDSVAAIMGSLNGNLLIKVGSGRMANTAADLVGADLLYTAFQFINPLSASDKTSNLECGVIKFDIKNGMATSDKGIAMQTEKVNVLGSGAIDLKTEQLDIRVKPSAREGLGINLGALTELMHIGGTLTDPKLTTDAKGVLRTAVTAGAAVATGGLSVLAQGLFDKTTADPHPCATALGLKPPEPVKPAAVQKPAEPKPATAQPTAPAATTETKPATQAEPAATAQPAPSAAPSESGQATQTAPATEKTTTTTEKKKKKKPAEEVEDAVKGVLEGLLNR